MFNLTATQLCILFAPALINIVAMIHILRRRDLEQLKRVLWMVFCVLVPVVSGLAYFISYYCTKFKAK